MTAPKRLIVNADDFALHPSANLAILKAHREGIVTSTTILAGGMAFFDSLGDLKDCSGLGIGVHLCLVDQKPVLEASQVPSLVDENGRFTLSYGAFVKKLAMRRIDLSEVRRELEAQVGRVLDHGLKITHLDSHQHLHLLPGICGIVAEISRKFGVRRVRLPAEIVLPGCESTSRLRRLQGRLVYRLARKRRREFKKAGLKSTDHFIGFDCGGCFCREQWFNLIPNLPPGDTEVMVHPGQDAHLLEDMTRWGYRWEEELAALTDPRLKVLLQDHGIQLINYGNLD